MTRLIKKIVSIILSLLFIVSAFMLVPVSVGAVSADSDFEFDNGTITKYIGIGGVVDIPSTIGGQSVTAIGITAFQNSYGRNVTDVTIPNTVTTIGDNAFAWCSNLSTVTFGNGVVSVGDSVFYNCYNLKEITIPNSVESIGEYAFQNCTGLESVSIGSGVTSLGNMAFYNCPILSDLTVPGNGQFNYNNLPKSTVKNLTVTGSYIKQSAFSSFQIESVTILNTVRAIGVKAFEQCSKLNGLTIPDSVSIIDKEAFYGCSSLTEVTIPGSVTSIENSAFSACLKLENVVICEGVESIGEYAFWGCTKLTNVTIPGSITTIGDYVFINSITDLTVPGDAQFDYSKLSASTVTNLTVTGTSVDSESFNDFLAVESVTFSETVENVDSYVFSNSNNLLFAVFLKHDTVIDENAFSPHKPIIVGLVPSTAKYFAEENGLFFINIDDFYALEESNFSVVPDNDGLLITDYNGTETDISIPTTIYEIPVIGIRSINNTDITSVAIPDCITTIDEGAFNGCSSLASINVNSNNSKYISVGGVLFNKNKTRLIQYPAAKTATTYSIPNSVSTIGCSAFNGCKKLKNIIIPLSVASIGYEAFKDCTGLTSIEIPDTVTVLNNGLVSGCTNLKSIKIGNSITTIPDGFFYGLVNLENVTIGNSVTSIPSGCFLGLTKLESVIIGTGVESINGGAFSGCSSLKSIEIPNSVTYLSSGVFGGCNSLKNVVIGNGLTTIMGGCFYGVSSLESVTIGSSVERIEGGAFGGCSSLKSIEIPDSVTYLSSGVFEDCNSLESVTIGNGITSIPIACFSGLNSLKSVILGDNVEQIGNAAFYNCSSLKSVVIPNSVTSIGDEAFSETGLTFLAIPSGVTSMGKSAFKKCAKLETVIIENGITYLDEYVFGYCTVLKNVTIPSSVTEIHELAFYGCPQFALYGHRGLEVACPPSFFDTYVSNYIDLDEYEYTINEKGQAIIDKYNGTDSEVEIPSEFPSGNGMHTVTAIGADAFKDKAGLTKATIPFAVSSIGDRAFEGCFHLTIYGSSIAAAYASNNNIPYVLLVKTNTGNGYTYAPLTSTQTKENDDSSFSLNQGVFGITELLGVQKKAEKGSNDMRFVAVINEGLIKDSSVGGDVVDYGFVMAKTRYTSTADAKESFIEKVTLDAPNTLKNSCMFTENSFSGKYGKYATDTKYKYLTLAVKNVPDNQGFVVRFYIKMKSGQVFYANYNTEYTGCVTSYAYLNTLLV